MFARYACADVSVADYRKAAQAEQNKKATAEDYLVLSIVTGEAFGLKAANIYTAESKKPLFCMSDSLVLNGELTTAILNQELKYRSYYKESDPVVWVLFMALQTTFPCHGSKWK